MEKTRAGLIAAGTGTRFRKAGFSTPKPMIKVAGIPLMGWVMRQFQAAGLCELTAIFNTDNCNACCGFLRTHFPGIVTDTVCLDTASSFESFYNVLSRSGGSRMLITTTDSIYAPGILSGLLEFANTMPTDHMVLGVTRFIDDEKPLYATMNGSRITGLGETRTDIVTSGVYLMPQNICRHGDGRQFPALRKFLAFLIENGVVCHGFDMNKSLDVDRPEDIKEAEEFIAAFGSRLD